MKAHEYQLLHCKHLEAPMLNIACKEDPARLGEIYGATNMDLLEYDPFTGTDLRTLPNFIKGSATAIPFEDGSFGGAIIGELLEHCLPHKALQILIEAKRILRKATDDWRAGELIVTFPLDYRTKEVQHDRDKLVQWDDGITSWHQTVWEDDKWATLITAAKLSEIHRLPLDYPGMEHKGKNIQGWGICLRAS
jgi:SAM-dependent methyltransferase